MLSQLDNLQQRIGYSFRDTSFLERALTHSSYSNETGVRNHHLLCNERLEFLGDSVLSLITSNWLYQKFPNLPEGDLTRIRAAIVCEEALASFSERIGLGEFLLLGKGEKQSGGAQKPAILADAFEAILAAIYLDAEENLTPVAAFLLPLVEQAVKALPETGSATRIDCKSRLQEFVQQDKEMAPLEYRLVGEEGPDHNKTFKVELYLGKNCIGSGSGHSKKNAEQMAARAALELFGQM